MWTDGPDLSTAIESFVKGETDGECSTVRFRFWPLRLTEILAKPWHDVDTVGIFHQSRGPFLALKRLIVRQVHRGIRARSKILSVVVLLQLAQRVPCHPNAYISRPRLSVT